MSFFSDEETDSLKITRMILHVVGTKHFEAMPERALEEEAFFIGKIVDMAAAPVFMFKAVSTTRKEIEAIAAGDTSFVDGAQSLAASFNRGYRAFRQSYRTCTPAAALATILNFQHGDKVSEREIALAADPDIPPQLIEGIREASRELSAVLDQSLGGDTRRLGEILVAKGAVQQADLDGALLIKDDPFDGAAIVDGRVTLNNRPGIGAVKR